MSVITSLCMEINPTHPFAQSQSRVFILYTFCCLEFARYLKLAFGELDLKELYMHAYTYISIPERAFQY